MTSAFCGANPPSNELEKLITEIQEDSRAELAAVAENLAKVLKDSRLENLGYACSNQWFIKRDKALAEYEQLTGFVRKDGAYEVVHVGHSWAVQTIAQKGNIPTVIAFRPTKEAAHETCKQLNHDHSFCSHPVTRESDGALVCITCGSTIAP